MFPSELETRLCLRAVVAALSAITFSAVVGGCTTDDPAHGSWLSGIDASAGDANADSPREVGDGGDADRKDGAAGKGGNGGSAGDGGDSSVDVVPIADSSAEADAEAGKADAPSGLTSCVSVAHIGDSLTHYTEPSLTAAYLLVGATAQLNAYGGRAILQKLPDDPMTGKQAATSIRSSGFSGCWVVALGTNDTANVAAGAWYTRAEAIDEMMNAIDPAAGVPVMWVNTYTTKTTGYWSNDNMVLWNQALTEALTRWPNLKIHDWASVADDGTAPYSDGIHPTQQGYEVRNASIAKALASKFPAP